jgi:hypothetical protein
MIMSALLYHTTMWCGVILLWQTMFEFNVWTFSLGLVYTAWGAYMMRKEQQSCKNT